MNSGGAAVDASVAVKWVIDEEYTKEARRLLRDTAGQPLAAAPHILSEVVNALYQRFRRGDLIFDELTEAVRQIQGFALTILEPPELYMEAAVFARAHNLRATYDSLYVVLAHRLGLIL